MKVIEVNSLQEGTNYTVNQIGTVQDQIETVRKAMNDFTALNDELRGQGGEALRAFYEECHQPFLIFLQQSLADYLSKLESIQSEVDSFEARENGYVDQRFLEGDVEAGFDAVEEKTIELTDEANVVIESIQDIINVTKLDESEVVDNVRRGKRKSQHIVEKLHSLDDTHSSALESVQADLDTMKTYVTEIDSRLQNGDLSVTDYSSGDLTDIEAYESMMESIYDSETIEPLLEKMKEGDTLTPFERDILYIYFQNEYLTADSKEELEEVASYINESDIGELEKRLNDKVVTSQTALEDEMALVQAYLFLGTKSPSATGVETDVRNKMDAYLMLLKDYHSRIDHDGHVNLVKVRYKKDHDVESSHFLESEIQSVEYNVADDLMSKDEFREWVFFDPDNFMLPKVEHTSITYAAGPHAGDHIKESELKRLKNKLADYETNFIVTKVMNKIISALAKKADISGFVEAGKTAVGYDSDKQKLEDDIEVGNAMTIADRLALDLSISEKRPGKGLEIQFYPTDSTFDKLERWKELHELNPDIAFPEDTINEHDWREIGNSLHEVVKTFESDTLRYISDGNKNGKSLEYLANAKK